MGEISSLKFKDTYLVKSVNLISWVTCTYSSTTLTVAGKRDWGAMR
jgi:hypothetical protein